MEYFERLRYTRPLWTPLGVTEFVPCPPRMPYREAGRKSYAFQKTATCRFPKGKKAQLWVGTSTSQVFFASAGDDGWEKVEAVERKNICRNLCTVVLRQKSRRAVYGCSGRDFCQDNSISNACDVVPSRHVSCIIQTWGHMTKDPVQFHESQFCGPYICNQLEISETSFSRTSLKRHMKSLLYEFLYIRIGFHDTPPPPPPFPRDFFLPVSHHLASIFWSAAHARLCVTDSTPTCKNLSLSGETNSKETMVGQCDRPDMTGLRGLAPQRRSLGGGALGVLPRLSDTLAGS